MKLTSNSLQSISNSNNLRMGLSYAKESHALFFERFSSHCAERIKDVFFVEKGTSITEAQTEDGDIPVVAGGKDMAYFHNVSNRPKGCITISASGANSGYVNYWDIPIWASDCITLRSKNEKKYSTKFLYHILRIIQDDVYLLQKGSDQPHVYGSDVKYIKIPPISTEQQTRILIDIRTLEEKIFTLHAEIKSESSIIDSVFSREFGWNYNGFNAQQSKKNYWVKPSNFSSNIDLRFSAKFHRNSGAFVMDELKKTTTKKIKHFLSEPIVLGASVSPSDYDDEGNYRYISMATIKNWKFDFDSANVVSDVYSEVKSAKSVKKNDIILARSGEGTIGKVALIQDDNLKGIFADFTMRIRLKDYNPEFAYYYFRTTYFQYLIEIYKKGLGNNTNIFPIVVREFPLIDIPVYEQERIVAEIHAEIDKQEKLKAGISDIQQQIDQIIEGCISK